MLLGSVVIAMLITGLVVALYAALDATAGARRAVAEQAAALDRGRRSEEDLWLALSVFRHDLANVLGIAALRGSLAEFLVGHGSPAEAQRAVAQLRAALADGTALLGAFTLDEVPCSAIAVDALCAHLAAQYGNGSGAVRIAPDLAGWREEVPAVTLTVLLGNLIKNALEATEAVELDRRDRTLVVRNRIADADRARLADDGIWSPGASSKGPGRGYGLASARIAARQCRADLRHAVVDGPGGPSVEFRLTFGGAAPAAEDAASGEHPAVASR